MKDPKLESIYDEVLAVKIRLLRLSNHQHLMSHEKLFCHQSRHQLDNVLIYLEDRIGMTKKDLTEKYHQASDANEGN